MPNYEQLAMAWAIVALLLIWSTLWKLVALWKAARRDQIGWYVVLALAPLFGAVEMLYVFWIAPRAPEIGETL